MIPELENISPSAVSDSSMTPNSIGKTVEQMVWAYTSEQNTKIRHLEEKIKQLTKELQTQEMSHKQEMMIKDLQIQVLADTLRMRNIPVPNITSPPVYSPPTPASSIHTFDSIIQSGVDKELLKKEMHTLIDGKGGVQVARVLAKAYVEKLIYKLPDKDEYSSEFTLNGTWRAISKYFKEGRPKDDEKFVQDYSSIRFTTTI